MSLPEVLLWQRLRGRRCGDFKFRRQHVLGPYFADFYCHELRLVVEIDGSSHNQRGEHDRARDAWMEARGLRVVRLLATEVLENPDDVADRLVRMLNRTQSG